MENKRAGPAVHLDKELAMRVLNIFVTVGIFVVGRGTMLAPDVRILHTNPNPASQYHYCGERFQRQRSLEPPATCLILVLTALSELTGGPGGLGIPSHLRVRVAGRNTCTDMSCGREQE